MKEDDSRRISSLAEKLLAEYEQARSPRVEVQPRPVVIREDAHSVEAQSTVEDRPQRPSLGSIVAAAAPKAAIDRSVWVKWIGTAVLGIVFGIPILYYHTTVDQSLNNLAFLFSAAAAVTALVQWFLFRNRLAFWWVPVNAVIGLGLAGLHLALYGDSGWGYENLRTLLIVWSIFNLVVGLVLFRSERVEDGPSLFPQTGKPRNLFLLLLSISLIAGNLASSVYVWQGYESAKKFWVLYGVVAIVAGFAFWRSKTPRNFGWIALVLFLWIDGASTALLGLTAEGQFPLYFFVLGGILAWASAVFFAFHTETWKKIIYVLLTGHLIAVGLADVTVYDTSQTAAWLKVAIPLGMLAAILLLWQQQRTVMKQNSEV
jgi:hypothetical protein